MRALKAALSKVRALPLARPAVISAWTVSIAACRS